MGEPFDMAKCEFFYGMEFCDNVKNGILIKIIYDTPRQLVTFCCSDVQKCNIRRFSSVFDIGCLQITELGGEFPCLIQDEWGGLRIVCKEINFISKEILAIHTVYGRISDRVLDENTGLRYYPFDFFPEKQIEWESAV